MSRFADETREWLETDGLGGFASGTVGGVRTRRYHALLLAATTPPTGRMVLVSGFDAWLQTDHGPQAVSTQRYAPSTLYPDGMWHIEAFATEPWPRWRYRLADNTALEQELFVPHGRAAVVLRWRLPAPVAGATLRLRPFLCGRDYHALHHENPALRCAADGAGEHLVFRPYAGVPAVHMFANAGWAADSTWYRNFLYSAERERGLDAVEDLASPGVLSWDLGAGDAVWILAADDALADLAGDGAGALDLADRLTRGERRRRRVFSPLHRAADAYLVRRGDGLTVIAGYPWFTDWGRDTFIALRGLCLATDRLDEARRILLAWAGAVSQGMLPNRFPDRGERPEYNAVDASLWYAVAVHDYLQRDHAGAADARLLRAAVEAILDGYAAGTRFGIRADDDGLLAAGEAGVQLTWMDARVGDRVVTPRIGKPVEVQALWLAALWSAARWAPRFAAPLARGRAAFAARFWNEARGCLFDVVDVDHRPGTADATLRPNQVLAVGGLPLAVLEGKRARRVVDAVERDLYTPVGLRSLAPGEPGYAGRYEGDGPSRDGRYHQGTAWPWLLGPFVEAWVRTHGDDTAARDAARQRFLAPLLAHLDQAGLGHVSEIVDGDPPHTPRGCPFQAWSLGELLRLDRSVLADR
jgi:predicted glycogen debranching enzyme